MRLSPYGKREWIGVSLVLVPIFLLCAWFAFGSGRAGAMSGAIGWGVASVLVLLLWIALLLFFRDPNRTIRTDLAPGVMLSPADGVISAIETVDEHVATDGAPATVIRIFLSVLNVHVNRAPCAGEVIAVETKPGKFLDARSPESATLNAWKLLSMRGPGGIRLGVRQVTGLIARRIVCDRNPGDHLDRGEIYGMIKFGSTTELILPTASKPTVDVAVGDVVKAGMTILATVETPAEMRTEASGT